MYFIYKDTSKENNFVKLLSSDIDGRKQRYVFSYKEGKMSS